MNSVPAEALFRSVALSLKEDLGQGDLTTQTLIPSKSRGRAFFVAKTAGVISGLPVIREVFRQLEPKIRFRALAREGQLVKAGTRVAVLQGPLRAILTGERVSLNFLGHLSGIATLTRKFVEKVKPFRVKIMDTRKTLPGLRLLEKYAVRCGGGVNHRMDLSSAVMVKDNHLESIGYDWQLLGKKLKKFRDREVVVEVDRLSDFENALALEPDVILLDNMKIPQIKKAVGLKRKSGLQIELEISGGVGLQTVRAIARTGVERISVGALTHSAPQLDLSLEIQ